MKKYKKRVKAVPTDTGRRADLAIEPGSFGSGSAICVLRLCGTASALAPWQNAKAESFINQRVSKQKKCGSNNIAMLNQARTSSSTA